MLNQFKIESFKMKRFIPFYVCIGIMIIIALRNYINIIYIINIIIILFNWTFIIMSDI